MTEQQHKRGGLLWGLAAYLWWGGMPLYFRAVEHVPAVEILAHRIVWCALLLALTLTGFRHWGAVQRGLAQRATTLLLFACSLLLAINWFCYIYAALSHRVMQGSLGYFLLPLVNIMFGVAFFRERLRPTQLAAVGIAVAGVVYLLTHVAEFPWLSLTIATTFGIYGTLRKITPIDGLAGLFIETLFLAPAAAVCVGWWWFQQTGTLTRTDLTTDLLLLASGPVTAAPLLCFGQAARRLPLITMGFLQYLSPTLQFLLAWRCFGEPFTPEKQVSFGLIWTALAVVTVDSLLAARAGLKRTTVEEVEPLEG